MTSEKSHISEEDFRRYLENQMSPEERNSFEKELQKSPFEADAIEGFEAISPEALKNDLSELRKKIIKPARKRSIPYFAAAATILLLITAGIIWIQFGNQNPIPEMAQTMEKDEKESLKTEPVLKSAEEPAVKREEKAPSPENENPVINQLQPAASKKSEKKPQPKKDEAKRETLSTKAVEEEAIIYQKNVAELAGVTPHSDSMLNEIGGVRAVAVETDETVAVLNDKEEEKVAAYSMQADLKKEKIRTFETVEEKVDFAEEIMPSAAPMQKRASRAIPIPETKAQPVSGMESYIAYLDSTAVLPADYTGVIQPVAIKFIIDQNGKPTHFENMNNADSLLFEKAKNIIVNGPGWNPGMVENNPVVSEKQIEIRFKRKSGK